MANQDWITTFGITYVEVISNSTLDYNPILSCVQSKGNDSQYRRKLWQYEARWNLDENCRYVIINS